MELAKLSLNFWIDKFFMENTNVETAFVEAEKYRNYYEGFTEIFFPYNEYWDAYEPLSSYEMKTSRTSGFVKTPWYGEPFNEMSLNI